jgi:hypothetical protein
MVDENSTQATITPQIVFENIGVGAKLLEQYISESETCEEFQAKVTSRLKSSARLAQDVQTKPQDYARVRNAVLAGEGIGKDLVQRYIPDAAKNNNVVSTVLASIYGERRAASAKAKQEAAQKEKARLDAELADRREQERAAEARRKADEAAAKEAQRKANEAVREQQAKAAIAKAQREAEAARARAEQSRRDRVAAEAEATKAKQRADLAQRELLATQAKAQEIAKQTSIPKEILLALGSPTIMADFATLVKRLGIPANKVAFAAEEVTNGGWTQRMMHAQLPLWWDRVSGAQEKRMQQGAKQRKAEAEQKRFKHGDLGAFIVTWDQSQVKLDRDLRIVHEYFEYASPVLKKNLADKLQERATLFQELADMAVSIAANPVRDVSTKPKMLKASN